MGKLKLKIRYICDNQAELARGLMKRDINDDECAFFDFKKKGCYGFWNRDVKYDLAVICADERMVIVDIFFLAAMSESSAYPESREVLYAIECKRGVLEESTVEKGDHIDFDHETTSVVIKSGKD